MWCLLSRQVIETTDRAAVGELITLSEFVDVVVPHSGKGLIERIAKDATVTVIKHLDGICHVYIDDQTDLDKAYAIAINAKTHRYATFNAMETLLVAEALPPRFTALGWGYGQAGVKLLGCDGVRAILPDVIADTEDDWQTEYLAPVLSIKVVSGLDQAIEHINHYGSRHTDSIVSENYGRGRRFIREIDSSSVMINASTRFADGYEYGLGAGGISTDKIHVRGPVGLEGLLHRNGCWVMVMSAANNIVLMKTIALFGGTFDPIHQGTQSAIELKQRSLDQLVLVPCHLPPHRVLLVVLATFSDGGISDSEYGFDSR